MADLTIRRTEPTELRAASDATRYALLDSPESDEGWARYEASWLDQDSFSAWDGDLCVGHTSAYRFDSMVPGGAWVPTAGITRVGVRPTHTRRGALTAMMRATLDDARTNGKVVAALRASETTIYGRFGYAVGVEGVAADVDTSRAGPVENPVGGSFRILRAAELLDVVPPLYERARQRAGAITRPRWMWERYLEEWTKGEKGHVVAVHTGADGADDGYAQYSTKWGDAPSTMLETGEGEIAEIRGTTPAVEIALWSYLLSVDLVRTYRIHECAQDDVIFQVARDRRAVRLIGRYDDQWIRLLDVGAALTARTYAPSEPVAIGVHDAWYHDNRGTWLVSGDGAERTDDAPALRCDIASLSAAYHGSVSWAELVDAGKVAEDRPGAARLADALFASRPLAFCGSFY